MPVSCEWDPTERTSGRVNRGTGRLHIFLLGDSIFNNAAYTRGEPDVVTHLRNLLPAACNGALPTPAEARRARRALSLFNDAIIRSAWELSCTIVELRVLCTETHDYAIRIEPSGTGGSKIARARTSRRALPGREPSAYAPFGARV